MIARIKAKHEEKDEVLRLGRELLALLVVNVFQVLRYTLVEVVWFELRINLSKY